MLEFDEAPQGLVRLIYASRLAGTAEPGFSERVQAITAKSIQNNRLVDITGFLVFGGDRFLQLLEGPAGEIETTFARIGRDGRHTDVTIISQGAAERRLFRDWNMAQHQVSASDQGLLAEVGLSRFTPEVLDEAGALKILGELGGRYRR